MPRCAPLALCAAGLLASGAAWLSFDEPAAAQTTAPAAAQTRAPNPLDWQAEGPSRGLPDVPIDLSGISWSQDSDSYLLVQNDGRRIYEFEPDLTTLRRVVGLADALDFDFEGIAALPGGRVAIANEANQIYVFSWPEGRDAVTVSLDLHAEGVGFLQLPVRARWNHGLEALCFDPDVGTAGVLYAIQESDPMRFFRVFLDAKGRLSRFDEPFDAQARWSSVLRDASGCVVDRELGALLVISHLSSKIVALSKDGDVLGEMALPGLHEGGASQYEGIEIGPGRRLIVASEPFLGTWPSRVRSYRWASEPRDASPAPR